MRARRISLLVKTLLLITIVIIGLGGILVALGVESQKEAANKSATIMGEKKIQGDIKTFQLCVSQSYGELSLWGNTLVDNNGLLLDDRFDLVDMLYKDIGVTATIFVRDGDDFRRVVTSIKNDKGERIIGTKLGLKSAAYPSMAAGKQYIGEALILGKPYITGYQPLFDSAGKDVIGILFVGIEMTQVKAAIAKSINQGTSLMVTGALISELLFLLLSGYLIFRILIAPLKSTVGVLRNISEGDGDLSRRLLVKSHDEIGDLAEYFNLTLEKVSNLVVSIKRQTETLSSVGLDLSVSMKETSTSIVEIGSSIKDVKGQTMSQSANVTETHATMEQINQHIEKVNSHIDQQSASVTQSSSAIQQMLANIESVSRNLVKNSENVLELSAASEQGHFDLNQVSESIKQIAKESESLIEISSVIGEIASQTNLLSMNAAIEAAHAGESGKGFAVVAEEIRRLAESSAEQSKTVSTVLGTIKDSVDQVVGSADAVLRKFEDINAKIKIVSEREAGIRSAMDEQSAGSKEILKAIASLNDITYQVKSGSGEMLDGSREVINESRNLGTITEAVACSMDKMTESVSQITAAVQRVNGISDANKKSIEALIAEVSRFKV